MENPDNSLEISDLRILVIETNDTTLNTIRQLLSSIGMSRPDFARSLTSARKKIKEDYNIVICDYNIGVHAGGKDLIESLRLDGNHMSSFVLTLSDHSRESVVSALECHPDDLLLKPYKMDDFKRRIRAVALKHIQTFDVRKLLTKGDFDHSLRILNQYIVEKKSSAYWCLKKKIDLYFHKEMFRQLEDYATYILSNENIEWVRTSLVEALYRQRKFNAAIEEAQKAIKKFPHSIKSHSLMGDCFYAMREYESAHEYHQKAVSISTSSLFAQNKLIKSQSKLGYNLEAISILNRVMRIADNTIHDQPEIYLCLANLHQKSIKNGVSESNAIQDAVTVISKALTRFPDHDVIAMSAQCYMAHSDFLNGNLMSARDRMKALETKYKDELEKSPAVMLNMALTLFSIGDELKAKKIIDDMEKNRNYSAIDFNDFIDMDTIKNSKETNVTVNEVKLMKEISDLKYSLESNQLCINTNLKLLNTYIIYMEKFEPTGSMLKDIPLRIQNAKDSKDYSDFKDDVYEIENKINQAA